jgi:DNA-binding NarL/FixJ family response regulator
MIDGAAVGPTIRVVLVDDQVLMRTAFRVIFDETDDIEVVGEAANGSGAVEAVRRTRPDVVLMDIRMPGADGIEATRLIRSQAGGDAVPRVLILTTFDLDEYVYEALRAGASGFCSRTPLPLT